jgi:hypothetical protein
MAADRRGAARRSGYDPDCWDAEGGDNCWHPTDDNLAGTASYGTATADPVGLSTYSVPFGDMGWTEMMLASGDLSMFTILSRSSIEECSTGQNNGQVS